MRAVARAMLDDMPDPCELHLERSAGRCVVMVGSAVLAEYAFVLRYMLGGLEDRLLVVNLGPDLHRASFAQPLMAPPRGCDWEVEWASEHPDYGALGLADLWPSEHWRIPGDCAVVLRPGRTRPMADSRPSWWGWI